MQKKKKKIDFKFEVLSRFTSQNSKFEVLKFILESKKLYI